MDAVFSSQAISVRSCQQHCRGPGRADRLHLGGHVGSLPIVNFLRRRVAGSWRILPRQFRAGRSGQLPRNHSACAFAARLLPRGFNRILHFDQMANMTNPFRRPGGLARQRVKLAWRYGGPGSISTGFGGRAAGETPGRVGSVAVILSADNTYYVKLPMNPPPGNLLRPFRWNRFKSMS